MQANDLIDRVEKLDAGLARDLRRFINGRKLGLVYEESKPEYVRLHSKPVVEGDLVNILPPRGTLEDMVGDDEADEIWRVLSIEGGEAALVRPEDDEARAADVGDLVAVARFDQTIYCGLRETGRVERGGAERPYHAVINGENFHALELLMFPYQGKVDCIYIDPPYNTGAKDWKYNNNYVSGEDSYRHSKWLTFMEDRLRLAKKLLNPECSVLICTIDEKEYLRLGLLLEQMFPEAHIQMVSISINPAAVARANEFGRSDEFAFFVMIGSSGPTKLELGHGWVTTKGRTHTGHIRKDLFRRSGSNSERRHSPGCFYPIYVDNNRVVKIGTPVPPGENRNDYIEDNGFTAVFPIRKNGSEGVWMGGTETAKSLLERGYLWIGKYVGDRTPIYYYASGEIAKIENGTYPLLGHDNNGVAIIGESSEKGFQSVPPTQWRMPGHDSTQYGTRLLQKFFDGEKRFTYPKSLYAVEDTLRFFLSDKPAALVVDFFAGSGTTVHAVLRLNKQDNGQRKCIAVTNNEVSIEDASRLSKQGLRAGDAEWEELGICSFVTVPRIKAAITGVTEMGNPVSGSYGLETEDYVENEFDVFDISTGQKVRRTLFNKISLNDSSVPDPFPMADGFEENAVFYDLTYLEPSAVTANLAFDEIAPLLWMRAGSVGPMVTLGDTDPEDATYEVTDAYGVLFDYSYAAPFIRDCRDRNVDHIFVVTDVDFEYRDMCAEFRGKDVKQLYKSYLRSFEIGQDR